LIGYTARAARQVAELQGHYERERRLEASRNLAAALHDAERRIEHDPAAGLPAPRPYPALERPGQSWIKAGPYWVRYTTRTPPIITGVFYDRANLPDRA
jgi:hypothetical protein